MRAFVYFNLHRKCWSVKALDGIHKGRVVAHAQYVRLDNVTFRVSEAGRQRVLRDKRKNVHAGAVGIVAAITPVATVGLHWEPVSYNPYKGPSFYSKRTADDVSNALSVAMGVIADRAQVNALLPFQR